MNKLYNYYIRLIGNILYFLIAKFNNKEYVLLDTCFRNENDGNIGAVYNYLKDKEKIVIVKNRNNIKKQDKYISKESLSYYIYLSKSKLVICNNAHHLYVKKSKKTKIVDTWHGTPYKDVSLSSFNKKIMRVMKKNTDYHISGNEYFEKKYLEETIDYQGKILRDGFFRNDILFDDINYYENEEFCNNGKKNILICPTWRDYGDDELIIKMNELIREISVRFEGEFNILLRYHSKTILNNSGKYINFYDVSGDIYETQKILKITDILITDYSSVFFDFALLERPILLYQYDLEEYKEKRGLLINDISDEYGMCVVNSLDNMLRTLENINKIEEKNRIEKFNFLIKNIRFEDSLDILNKLLVK